MKRLWPCAALLCCSAIFGPQVAQAVPAEKRILKACPDEAVVRIFTIRGIELMADDSSAYKLPLVVPNVGHGSGALISWDGLVLTARHVVENATGIAVVPSGSSKPIAAKIVYVKSDDAEQHDYAFIKINGMFDKWVPFPPKQMKARVGTAVAAQGYPRHATEERPAFVPGFVQRAENKLGLIEVGTQFDPGISGGPVCSAKGILGVAIAREGYGGNYVAPIRNIVSSYEFDVKRGDLIKASQDKMQGDEFEEYSRYSELATELLIAWEEIKRKGYPQKELEDFFTGYLKSSRGEDTYQKFRRVEYPAAKLVVAAFLWNEVVISMHVRGCDAADCATDKEKKQFGDAVLLIEAAVAKDPSLKYTGGTVVQAALEAIAGQPQKQAVAAELDCSDMQDNDGDGLMDCGDDDCAAFCREQAGNRENTKSLCSDRSDNDGDGREDCDDQDCSAFCPEEESTWDFGGRPRPAWNDWRDQFGLYAGPAFQSPLGSDFNNVYLGGGFFYQRRIWGWDATRWFSLDLCGAVDAFVMQYRDVLGVRGLLISSYLPGGALAAAFEPTVRVALGADAGVMLEAYYPLTFYLSAPFLIGYKNWGARLGFFIEEIGVIGLNVMQQTPGNQDQGMSTLFFTVTL